MSLSILIALLQDAPVSDSANTTVKLISGVLAAILVVIIIMRRRGAAKKKADDDEF
jgi:hypothetical protein